jgi:1,4-dihydroxy-2-naphthoate octaprenyltransferase
MFTWAILAVLAFAIGFLFSTMIYTIIPFFPLLVLLVIISLIVIFKSFINFYFSLIYKIEDEGRQNSLVYYKIAKKALNWKITLKYVIITLGLYLP